MASEGERIENIKTCAEERSQLQFKCLQEVDLGNLKTKELLARARLNFEKCESENLVNYPCLVRRETLKYTI